MNKAKQKLIIDNISPKIVIISSLNNSNKKIYLNLILLKKQWIFNIKNINIIRISINVYCVAYCLKKA